MAIQCQTVEHNLSSYIAVSPNFNVRPSPEIEGLPESMRVNNFAVNSDRELLFVVPTELATAINLFLEVRTRYTENGTLRVTRYNTILAEV